MDPIVMLFMLLWMRGLRADIQHHSTVCSEPDDDVRLVGGASRCAGGLEMKHRRDWKPLKHPGEWKPVIALKSDWNLKSAAVVCRQLDCGSAVSTGSRRGSTYQFVWRIEPDCDGSESEWKQCVSVLDSSKTFFILEVICSESVRLVNGTSRCSGRVEVKSNQSWSSVCDADFDQQDAQVVCRELGCGAPSVLQGALYGEVEAPLWTKEFQCEGSESLLRDCGTSDSHRNTCSPGKAVGLTCSGPDDVRLVGGASRCAGGLEMNHQGDWKPVLEFFYDWNLKSAAVVCRHLDCGSAVSTGSRRASTPQPGWRIRAHCDGSESELKQCVSVVDLAIRYSSQEVICSDLLLVQPIISLSPSMDGVSEAQQQGLHVFNGSIFTISCSIQPQYPGGSFHLTFTGSNTTDHIQPAVNHSAHFLFPAADHAHQGNYSCVYHVHVFSRNFSSESFILSLIVSGNLEENPTAFPTEHIIIPVVVLLVLVLVCGVITVLYFYCKATRGQKPGRQENVEYYNLGGSSAEGGPSEEAGGAQGAEEDPDE